jgi:hypothetical protein
MIVMTPSHRPPKAPQAQCLRGFLFPVAHYGVNHFRPSSALVEPTGCGATNQNWREVGCMLPATKGVRVNIYDRLMQVFLTSEEWRK